MAVRKLTFVQNPYSRTLKTAQLNGIPSDIYYSVSNDKDRSKFNASFVTNFNTSISLGIYETLGEAEQGCQNHFEELIKSNLE